MGDLERVEARIPRLRVVRVRIDHARPSDLLEGRRRRAAPASAAREVEVGLLEPISSCVRGRCVACMHGLADWLLVIPAAIAQFSARRGCKASTRLAASTRRPLFGRVHSFVPHTSNALPRRRDRRAPVGRRRRTAAARRRRLRRRQHAEAPEAGQGRQGRSQGRDAGGPAQGGRSRARNRRAPPARRRAGQGGAMLLHGPRHPRGAAGCVDDRQGLPAVCVGDVEPRGGAAAVRRIAAFDEPLAASQQRADADAELVRQRQPKRCAARRPALERGHAAAEAAGAGAEEDGDFCVARAQASRHAARRRCRTPAARRRCARRRRGRRRRQNCRGGRARAESRARTPSPIRRRCRRTPARCSRAARFCSAARRRTRRRSASRRAQRSRRRSRRLAPPWRSDTAKGDDVPEALSSGRKGFGTPRASRPRGGEAAARRSSRPSARRATASHLMAAPTLESLNLLGDILRAAAEHACCGRRRSGGGPRALYSRRFGVRFHAAHSGQRPGGRGDRLADGWLDCARPRSRRRRSRRRRRAGARGRPRGDAARRRRHGGAAAAAAATRRGAATSAAEYRALLSEPAAAWAAAGMSARSAPTSRGRVRVRARRPRGGGGAAAVGDGGAGAPPPPRRGGRTTRTSRRSSRRSRSRRCSSGFRRSARLWFCVESFLFQIHFAVV